jgi:hypothetical protein
MAWVRATVRSLFGKEVETKLPQPVLIPADLPYELDIGRLDIIAARRKVLDWHDEYCAVMAELGRTLLSNYSTRVEQSLDNVGLLRRMFTRPAVTVMAEEFYLFVESPLLARAKAGETSLKSLAQKVPQPNRGTASFSYSLAEDGPSGHLETCMPDLGFTPANRKKIMAALETAALGTNGIVDRQMRRARKVIALMLQNMEVRP